MEPQTLLFNLSAEIQYTKNGNFENTAQLEVDGPCFLNLKQSTILSQFFARALMSSRKHIQQDEVSGSDQNAEIGTNEVKLLLLGSDVDFSEIVNAFVDLCAVSCTLDQDRKIRFIKDHLAKFNYEDIINFVCEYIATFIVPSVLVGLTTEG
jgi:hypothetical protein